MFDAHSTTILSVRRGRHVAIAGDGQVSLGNTIMKGNARKIRRLYKNRILAGFAGIAKELGVKSSTITLIQSRLNQIWQENNGLLA